MRTALPDLVAFDLDGTLADTGPDLAASLNHALSRLGRAEIEQAEVRAMVGQGARMLIRRGLAATGEVSDVLLAEALPLFMDFYADHICDGTRPFDGVEEALDALRAEGVALALCTNKPEGLTHLLLDALGWTGRFDSVVGGDSLPVRKPDPAPLIEAIRLAGGGRSVFVGDSITDADTARAAGLPFVAVRFGFSDRPVEALGADRIIDRFEELLPALATLNPSAGLVFENGLPVAARSPSSPTEVP